jgi:pimeloyl-ACP methyl ester carboxylesterase
VTVARRDLVLGATALALPARAADGVPVRRHYVEAWTGQIHLRYSGERGAGKRPLVCLHPSLATSLNFAALLADMGRDRYAVAPDTPGYGMSDPPPSPPAIADYARAMADVVDALQLAEFDLFGAHTGGMIAVELARLRPVQVRHVALLAAPVHTADDIKRLRERNPVDPPDADGDFLVRAWTRRAAARDPRLSLADVAAKFPDYLMGGDKRVWGQAAAFAYHMEETIGSVTAPVMVLNYRGDLYEPTKRIAPYIKTGTVVDLPQYGSAFLERDTAAAAELLRGFFDGN